MVQRRGRIMRRGKWESRKESWERNEKDGRWGRKRKKRGKVEAERDPEENLPC